MVLGIFEGFCWEERGKRNSLRSFGASGADPTSHTLNPAEAWGLVKAMFCQSCGLPEVSTQALYAFVACVGLLERRIYIYIYIYI